MTPHRDMNGSKIESVEVLRGIAALAVAWFHLTGHGNWVQLTGAYGRLGVEVFFVVSGFIIPYSIWCRYQKFTLGDFPNYMLRRLVRLEPPYLASIILVLLLWQASSLAPNFAGADPDWTPSQVVFHFAYAIPLTEYSWLQPVYWTLAYEFVFYIVVGLLFGFTDRPRSKIWLAVAFVVLFLTLADLLPDRSLLFVMGISVFRSKYLDENPSWSLLTVSVAALAMFLDGSPIEAGVGILTASIIWFPAGMNFKGKFWQPFFELGKISYALYLVHVPVGGRVVNLLNRYMPEGDVFDFVVSVLALLVSLSFAVVFWKLCEKPAIGWSRTLRALRTTQGAA